MSKKINIPKSELYDLYVTQEMSLEDICEYFGCGKTTLCARMKEYGINKSLILEKYYLTPLQRDLIIGSLLGDGTVTKSKAMHNYVFSIQHAENQIDYLRLKFNVMKNLSHFEELSSCDGNILKSENAQMSYYFRSRSLPIFNEFKEMSIQEAINQLNETSMLIWLMDDSHLQGRSYRLACKRFSFDDIELAIDYISKKFNSVPRIDWDSKNHTTFKGLYFTSEESAKLIDSLKKSELFHDINCCMRYKFP